MARAAAAIIAVVAVAIGAIWLLRPKDSGPDPGAWEAKARDAFQPLVQDVPDLVRGAREWQSGERPADVYGDRVRKALADFVRTRERVTALKPSPEKPQAGELYENSAQLYVE